MRRHGPSLLLSLALLAGPALPADGSDADEVRQALARGRTARAAQMAEQALEKGATDTAPELRYLLFKAHVVDLGPDGAGELYARIAGDAKDGMERYEAQLAQLEAAVRADGTAALPALVPLLDGGDRLDRLLVLGILRDMAGQHGPATWGIPPAPGIGSPIGAASAAVRRAADDCSEREVTLGIAAGAASLTDQLEREAYVQETFAVESGVEFLAQVDRTAWGVAAAAALACVGAQGAVLDDRARLERDGSALREPLRELLGRTDRLAVRLVALDLLGRHGACADVAGIEALRDEGVREAAAAAADRIRRRKDCS